MKILISCLQVSESGSKGHFYPALEISLAFQKNGHEVFLLPLPMPFSASDKEELNHYHIKFLDPPILPKELQLSGEKLATLASHPDTLHEAYEAFLITPVIFQFEKVLSQIRTYQPDILIYDLLVYAAPLAARKLGIKEIGYCAGLKLIAPDHLTQSYKQTANKILNKLSDFFNKINIFPKFHHLELLSNHYQIVFAATRFKNLSDTFPANTILVGPLAINPNRLLKKEELDCQNPIVLCFGSALDPFFYPNITDNIIRCANYFQKHLIIVSRYLKAKISNTIHVVPYLSLPEVMKKTAILIHHGGANTFSEALYLGVPQILIPLVNDQPIQAELLQQSQAGIVIYPNELSDAKIFAAFVRLLNKEDAIHKLIQSLKEEYHLENGPEKMVNLVMNHV